MQTKVQKKIINIEIFIFTLFSFTYFLSPGIKTKLRQLFSQNLLWDNSFNVGCLSKVFEHIEFIIMEPQVVNLIKKIIPDWYMKVPLCGKPKFKWFNCSWLTLLGALLSLLKIMRNHQDFKEIHKNLVQPKGYWNISRESTWWLL